eukprot:scaffold3504_cov240-Pinguiococcus_pyrenoidosus.AAC.55
MSRTLASLVKLPKSEWPGLGLPRTDASGLALAEGPHLLLGHTLRHVHVGTRCTGHSGEALSLRGQVPCEGHFGAILGHLSQKYQRHGALRYPGMHETGGDERLQDL